MRRAILSLIGLLLALSGCAGGWQVRMVIPDIRQSMVMVESETGYRGSGVVIWRADGRSLILTVAHALSDMSSMSVRTDDTEPQVLAEVLSRDATRDLALLASPIERPSARIATAPVRVGESVWVVHRPDGIGWAVTTATLSADHRRPWLARGGHRDIPQQEFEGLVWGGSSGGGIFSHSGQLVGLVNGFYVGRTNWGMPQAMPLGYSARLADIRTFLAQHLSEWQIPINKEAWR